MRPYLILLAILFPGLAAAQTKSNQISGNVLTLTLYGDSGTSASWELLVGLNRFSVASPVLCGFDYTNYDRIIVRYPPKLPSGSPAVTNAERQKVLSKVNAAYLGAKPITVTYQCTENLPELLTIR